MEPVLKIGRVTQLDELRPQASASSRSAGVAFADRLKESIQTVDGLQRESEAAQTAFAGGEDIDLHEVLIKVEEAELAFRAMMEVRTKLVEAYREIMRLGSGG